MSFALMETQLSLSLWPETTLRGCLDAYMLAVVPKLAAATVRDYGDRAAWLCARLGETTPISEITFARLERLAKHPGDLKLVTIRKRLRMLRAALKYAQDRDLIAKVPSLPPQLTDDGQRGQDFYTVAQFAKFAETVPDGRYRRFFALGFWTGMHTYDLRTTTSGMLDPDFEWRDADGVVRLGRYWRRNHKNKRCAPCWFPMEPEFRALVIRWKSENPHWADFSAVVGRIWGTSSAAGKAAKEAGLEYVTPNLGLRRSHATMLASRGYQPEYIRGALGHEGEARVSQDDGGILHVTTHRPTIATSHYLRPSPDMFTRRRVG